MHLWPTMKIRDSFKFASVQNYERNLRRMTSEKQSAAIKQKLLQGEDGDADREAAEGEAPGFRPPSAIVSWGRDLLAVLSCFFCCDTCEARPVGFASSFPISNSMLNVIMLYTHSLLVSLQITLATICILC